MIMRGLQWPGKPLQLVSLHVHVSSCYVSVHLHSQLFSVQIGDKNLLQSQNVVELQNLIWEARTKYYNIGLELRPDAATLDSITQSQYHQVDDCFHAVLGACIRKGITKTMIVNALKSPTVGNDKIAEEVQNHSFILIH